MSDSNCLFCKIIERQIPSNIVFEDELCLGFKDINPMAPLHVLFIPKKHIVSLAHAKEEKDLLGHILTVIARFAEIEGLEKNGYRVVTNTGGDAG
ncbi:MAG: HIT domain-containing protein, partial [Leptospiraceae bacterium]|nr:HIT domain-containing protein [Leptospiraceae bacterium]